MVYLGLSLVIIYIGLGVTLGVSPADPREPLAHHGKPLVIIYMVTAWTLRKP